jgi:hypothetical protein
LETIARIPNAELFDQYAYHVELLVVFSSNETAKAILTGISSGDYSTSSAHRKSIQPHQPSAHRKSSNSSVRRNQSFTNGTKLGGGATASMTGSNHSIHSASSFRGSVRNHNNNRMQHKLSNQNKKNPREGSMRKISKDTRAVEV